MNQAGGAVVVKTGQFGQLVRTLGSQLKETLRDALGRDLREEEALSHRALVVAKVSRNAVAELVNQARNHPQRGDLLSASPAYVALAELSQITGIPGLALGVKNETGELCFLDLDAGAKKAGDKAAYVDRARNRNLWRQLKHLAALKVDRTMLGPSRPVRSPEDDLEAADLLDAEETVDENDN